MVLMKSIFVQRTERSKPLYSFLASKRFHYQSWNMQDDSHKNLIQVLKKEPAAHEALEAAVAPDLNYS